MSRRRKAEPIKDTKVFYLPSAKTRDDDDDDDDDDDEIPPYTKQDAKITLEDLKTAVEKFNRNDQAIYEAQLEALNNPKNRREALIARIPEPTTIPTTTTTTAERKLARKMKLARKNIIDGLEMIDLLEQIDILDTMIGDLGGLERQIQNRISKLIRKGCNIETLTGNPMKPPDMFRWEYGPSFPGNSAELFSTECSEIAFLQEVMLRVVKLSDQAETEGTTWGNKLKNFNRSLKFEDPYVRDVFSSLGKSFEELAIQADDKELRERRRRRKKEKEKKNFKS